MSEFTQPQPIFPAATHEASPANTSPELSQENTTDLVQESRLRRVGQWFIHNPLYSGAILAAGSMAYTGITTPYQEMFETMREQGPEAATLTGLAIGVSEALFIGGLALGASGLGIRRGQESEEGESKNIFGRVKDTIMSGKNSENWNYRRVRTGINLNLLGALGTPMAATIGAVTYLPDRAAASVTLGAAVDVGLTLAARRMIFKGVTDREKEHATTPEKEPKLVTRKATLEDLGGIVALDLRMFKDAYGEKKPEPEAVREMMRRRMENIGNDGGWMFVQTKGNDVVGLISVFRTNKPAEDFISWEDSTNNGTLDNCIEPNGKYAYIANLTVAPGGRRQYLQAAAIAEGVRAGGVEYAYWESRMPDFRKWLGKELGKNENEISVDTFSKEELSELASTYRNLRNKDGSLRDKQLRMYSKEGAKLSEARIGIFDDAESLNCGVMCEYQVPFMKAPLPVRIGLRNTVKFLNKHNPKLLDKIL